MDIISELENRLAKSKTRSSRELENIAIEFLSGVDFSDKDNVMQAEKYINNTLANVVGKNLTLNRSQAKAIHCMITKMSLDKLGLKDVKVNYADRTAQHTKTGAYYLHRDKSINFFNNDVCNESEWLLPYTNDPNKGARVRLDHFARQVFVIEHEIQHVVQFKEMEATCRDKELLNPESYVMQRQVVAREFAQAQGSKYYKPDAYIDRLYRDNHDQFYFELDADVHGIARMLDDLKTLSPQAYEIATDKRRNRYLEQLESKAKQINNYSAVAWKHDTNPNKMEVSANHKASLVIDNVLPNLGSAQRKEYMDMYPALSITYNANGTLKSLEEIEKEKQVKINEVLRKGTDEQIQVKATNIAKLYDTAIESHPVLCFKHCLQHMARLNYDSDRYFTDGGSEFKYNPQLLYTELEKTGAKACAVASYMEDTDAKQLKGIFDKYKKEIMSSARKDKDSVRLFEAKKLAIYNVQDEIYKNKEVYDIINRDAKVATEKARLNRMQQEKAQETIKKVFPGFTPTPQSGVIKEDGGLELVSNASERIMLIEAYKQYVSTLVGNNNIDKTDKDFVPTSELLTAINSLYSSSPTKQEKERFYESLKKGEVQIVRNRYQVQEDKSAGDYSEVESETKPVDPESDATNALFKSRRQDVVQANRKVMEEKNHTSQTEVRSVTKEELDNLKKHNPELDTHKSEEQKKQDTVVRQKEQEETYVDEFGVVMKRKPNGQSVKPHEHNQDIGLTR